MSSIWLPPEKPEPKPAPEPVKYDIAMRLRKGDCNHDEYVELFRKLVRMNDGCGLHPDGRHERLTAILDLAYAITGMDFEVRT